MYLPHPDRVDGGNVALILDSDVFHSKLINIFIQFVHFVISDQTILRPTDWYSWLELRAVRGALAPALRAGAGPRSSDRIRNLYERKVMIVLAKAFLPFILQMNLILSCGNVAPP